MSKVGDYKKFVSNCMYTMIYFLEFCLLIYCIAEKICFIIFCITEKENVEFRNVEEHLKKYFYYLAAYFQD